MIKIRKKRKVIKKIKKTSMVKPYLIYKFNYHHNFLLKEFKHNMTDDKLGGIIKVITEKGKMVQGEKFNVTSKFGKLIYRSKNGLYGIWENKLTKSIYLLLYVDYGDIKGNIKKMVV